MKPVLIQKFIATCFLGKCTGKLSANLLALAAGCEKGVSSRHFQVIYSRLKLISYLLTERILLMLAYDHGVCRNYFCLLKRRIKVKYNRACPFDSWQPLIMYSVLSHSLALSSYLSHFSGIGKLGTLQLAFTYYGSRYPIWCTSSTQSCGMEILWTDHLSGVTSVQVHLTTNPGSYSHNIILYPIGSRLTAASGVAFPAAFICIQRRIYHVVSDPLAITTTSQVCIPSLWGGGYFLIVHLLQETTQACVRSVNRPRLSDSEPDNRYSYAIYCKYVLWRPLVVYIFQPTRYGVYEDFGCRILVVSTAMSVVLILVPLLAICLVSGVYGCKNTSLRIGLRKNLT
jgi:Pheromone A receptor